jgi:hypothetical protein
MNKFIPNKKELLGLFQDATGAECEDVLPILDIAIRNFERELKIPLKQLDKLNNSLKIEYFDVLLKHFTASIMNKDHFMKKNNISEIKHRINSIKL